MQLYPQRKLIVGAMPGIIDNMEPDGAFLGVWSYDNQGVLVFSLPEIF